MKKILLILILGMFLIGCISAADWDNSMKFNEETNTVTVSNTFGLGKDLIDVTLDENFCEEGRWCEADKTIMLHEDSILVEDFKTLRVDDDSWEEQDIRWHKLEYWGTIEDFEEECYLNETNNETFCEQIKVGEHEDWIQFYEGDEFKKGIYHVRTTGEIKPGRVYDWQIKVHGKWTTPFAIWGASFVGSEYQLIIIASDINKAALEINDVVVTSLGRNLYKINTTNADDEVSRALIMKTLFYGTTGSDPRATKQYINATQIYSNDARDDNKRGVKAIRSVTNEAGTYTGTFYNTVDNYNVSSWSIVNYGGHSNDELGTDRKADQVNNPANVQLETGKVGTYFSRYEIPSGLTINTITYTGAGNDAFVKSIILSDGNISWSGTGSNKDFYEEESFPLFQYSNARVTLNSPEDEDILTINEVTFNASAEVTDGSCIVNMSLWTNNSGNWEINYTNSTLNILNLTSGTTTLGGDLIYDYVYIGEDATVLVNSTIKYLNITSRNDMYVYGTVDGDGAGYAGGTENLNCNDCNGNAGSGTGAGSGGGYYYGSVGSITYQGNGGGGAGANSSGGNGGRYLSYGNLGSGGSSYMSAIESYIGSGGGGGGIASSTVQGDSTSGGSGGAAIYLKSDNLYLASTSIITANGNNGGTNTYYSGENWAAGGGGGGSGGSIFLEADNMTTLGSLSVIGGSGGNGEHHYNADVGQGGGGGSGGIIYLKYDSAIDDSSTKTVSGGSGGSYSAYYTSYAVNGNSAGAGNDGIILISYMPLLCPDETKTLLLNSIIMDNIIWNVQVCDSDGDCGFSISNYTLYLDTIFPQLFLDYPTGILNYKKYNNSLETNFSASDANLDSVWYNYNGTNITIDGALSEIYNQSNITLTEKKNITIYANDTVGNLNETIFDWDYKIFENSRNLTNQSYETKPEIFSINVTDGTNITSVKLVYNGTEYSTTKSGQVYSKTLDIPVNQLGNNSVRWKFDYGGDIFYSDYSYQQVNETVFTLCNASYTNKILNLTFKDESSLEFINATIPTSTFDYYLGSGSEYKTYTYSNVTENYEYDFCATPNLTFHVDPYVQYKQGTDYPQRIWNPDILDFTTELTNRILYLLNAIDGIYVTFQVINAVEQGIANVLLTGERIIESETVEVANGLTDAGGGVTFWLNPDFVHTFNFTKAGYDFYQYITAPTQSTYTVTLGAEAELDLDCMRGLSYNIYPSNDQIDQDTLNYFNFTVLSGFWTLDNFTASLYNEDYNLIDSETISGEESGTISFEYNVTNQTKVYMTYNIYTNGSLCIDNSKRWIIQSTEGRSFSLFRLFSDISLAFDNNFYGIKGESGEDNFGIALLTFFVLVIIAGTMITKYGITNEMSIMGIIFGLVLFLEVGVGLIPSIDIFGTEIQYLISIITGLAWIVFAIRER